MKIKVNWTAVSITSVFAPVLGSLSGCLGGSSGPAISSGAGSPSSIAANESVAKANSCRSTDKPETDIQGRVTPQDRDSGRSKQGYSCNLSLIGQYQGEGATWVNPIYKDCAYMGTSFSGIPLKARQGVQVVDASDPRNPKFATNLTSPAFAIGPWESLKVNEKRGLLAGAAVGPILGAVFLDVYDISKDCKQPVLLNKLAGNLTLPQTILGHEGGWSPDGNTYWVTSTRGDIAAIGLEDPTKPKMLYMAAPTDSNHGFEFSTDGNRMYAATINPTGVNILDVSDIQQRKPNPQIRLVGSLHWSTSGNTQSTIPFTQNGRKLLVVVDELETGVVRILDIQDEKKPVMVSHLKLDIHQTSQTATRQSDNDYKAEGQLGRNGLFGYESHYCTLDNPVDPTAMACGYFQSGIRVFDIRNPAAPREFAYFNPPAQADKKLQLQGSEHNSPVAGQNADFSTDWCSSPPVFKPNNQLWVVCQDNGFMALEFAEGTYPLR